MSSLRPVLTALLAALLLLPSAPRSAVPRYLMPCFIAPWTFGARASA